MVIFDHLVGYQFDFNTSQGLCALRRAVSADSPRTICWFILFIVYIEFQDRYRLLLDNDLFVSQWFSCVLNFGSNMAISVWSPRQKYKMMFFLCQTKISFIMMIAQIKNNKTFRLLNDIIMYLYISKKCMICLRTQGGGNIYILLNIFLFLFLIIHRM